MLHEPARSRSKPRWPLRTAPGIAEPSSLPAEVLSHWPARSHRRTGECLARAVPVSGKNDALKLLGFSGRARALSRTRVRRTCRTGKFCRVVLELLTLL